MKDATQPATTRDAILDATDRLLARYGYKKMTIDDLAKEVGIGKGSVYLHFDSKQDIALSHIDRIIERLKASLHATASSKLSPEKKVRKMLHDRVLMRFDSVQHYSQSLNELLAQLRARLLERRKRYFEEEARIFATVLAAGKASRAFDLKDPFESALALLDATNALLPYGLSAYELGERSVIEKKTANVTDLVMSGLLRK